MLLPTMPAPMMTTLALVGKLPIDAAPVGWFGSPGIVCEHGDPVATLGSWRDANC
jgi:hypothetical protein